MPTARNNWKVLVGLTGGMGSGKSTVLDFFKKKGAFVLDSDKIVHELLKKDRVVLSTLRKKFGNEIFDKEGRLLRSQLAKQVFVSNQKRRFLEHLIHPRVRKKIWSSLKHHRGKIAVVDVPLLYESGWPHKFDRVVVADANLKTRLARLVKKGFDKADARRRIELQMDLRTKVRRANFVVNNNGSLQSTKKQVDEIWKKIKLLPCFTSSFPRRRESRF